MKKIENTPTKQFQFTVTGYMDIDAQHKTLHECTSPIVGFTDANGREYRLVVALEVLRKDGTYEYITDDDAMLQAGFSLVEYDDTSFHKYDDEPSDE